jgi:hypothetical protein
MSIRREQEHVSLALSAAVSIPRRIGSLPKRRCNKRLQTSRYDLLIFPCSGYSPVSNCAPSHRTDEWPDATRKQRQVEFTKTMAGIARKHSVFGQHALRSGEEEKHSVDIGC